MNKVFSVSDKKHPATLSGGRWYTLAFIDDVSKVKTVAAKVPTGGVSLSVHLYFEVPSSGRPSYIKVRLVRHRPSGLDTTANSTYTLPSSLGRMTIVHNTVMGTRSDTPISVQVYLDKGSARLVERIYKGYE